MRFQVATLLGRLFQRAPDRSQDLVLGFGGQSRETGDELRRAVVGKERRQRNTQFLGHGRQRFQVGGVNPLLVSVDPR